MGLELVERDGAHAQILSLGIAVGVVAEVGGGGEDGVLGGDGHEVGAADQVGEGGGSGTSADDGGAEEGAENSHGDGGRGCVVWVYTVCSRLEVIPKLSECGCDAMRVQ